MAHPISVPKNQYSAATTMATAIIPTRTAGQIYRKLTVNGYWSTLKGTLDFPIMRILIEYSANCVRMPDKIAGIPKQVCKTPVTRPVNMPAIKANTSASNGFIPPTISTAATAPPVHKLPSTVRSA